MLFQSKKRQERIRLAAIYVFLIIASIFMILPYFWMVATSFKPIEEIQAYPPSFWIKNPTLESYIDLFTLVPMARFILNSLIVAGSVTLSQIFFCSLAGYAFAKHRFWGRDKWFFLLLGSMMIPWKVYLIPGFIIVKNLGWLNTYYALIIPNLAEAFGIFLCRQYIMSIPDDLIDAAKIDGCGEFRIYWTVIFPLIKPVLATLAIFTFLAQWNSLVWPLVVIYASKMRTVALALAVLNSQYGNNFAMLMAAASIITIPILILFVVFHYCNQFEPFSSRARVRILLWRHNRA